MGIVIVYGPKACGKTRHAEQFRKAFDCARVVDDWDGVRPLKEGDLALTNVEPSFYVNVEATVIDVVTAFRRLRVVGQA